VAEAVENTLPDRARSRPAGMGLREMTDAREPAASGLEKGRALVAVETGRLRIMSGEVTRGRGGTGLLSESCPRRESGLSLAVVAYVVQLRWLTGSWGM
jgi:hypothetical protein